MRWYRERWPINAASKGGRSSFLKSITHAVIQIIIGGREYNMALFHDDKSPICLTDGDTAKRRRPKDLDSEYIWPVYLAVERPDPDYLRKNLHALVHYLLF